MARPDSTRAARLVTAERSARSVRSVRAMAPIAIPIAAAALGLFLLGRLLDAPFISQPASPPVTALPSTPVTAALSPPAPYGPANAAMTASHPALVIDA